MLNGHFIKSPMRNMIIISVLIILLIVVIYLYSNTLINENFKNLSRKNLKTENTENIEYDKYAKNQRDLFWNKTNKNLFYNPEIEKDMKNVSGALTTIDPIIRNKNRRSIGQYFVKNPLIDMEKKNEKCSLVKEPKYLPERDKTTNTGCGWWYNDDPDINSVGAYGNHNEPFDSTINNKYPGGRWIWDLKQAQLMEEIKQCKMIKVCEQADVYPGKCGFCVSSDTGIPVDGRGRVKYPDNENLNCDKVITNPEYCPGIYTNIKPVNGKYSNEYLILLAKAVGCTNDGIIVKILSSGNYDKYLKNKNDEIELFKLANKILQDDEKLSLKVECYGKGSCEKEAAIKYYTKIRDISISGKTKNSRDSAKYLMKGTLFDPCLYSKTQTGPFSLLCLKRVALENNCQPDGTDFPSLTPKKVIVPKECGKYGRPNSDAKKRLYTESECEMLNGYYNGDDDCRNKDGGSYNKECSGLNEIEMSPMSTKSIYDKMKWEQVGLYFKNLYDGMISSDKNTQIDSTKRCLGIDIVPSEPECDDKVGCEILWYSWNYDYSMPDDKIAKGTFLGRTIQNTLPKFNVEGGNGSFNPFNIKDNISFHIRTVYSNKQAATNKFGLVVSGGVCIKIDDEPIAKKWLPGPQQSITTSLFKTDTVSSKNMDIYWFKERDRSTFIHQLSNHYGINDYHDISPKMLKLRVPSDYPLVRWDFYNDSFDDRNSVLRSEKNSIAFDYKDGKKCVVFNNNSSLSITNSVYGTIFKSFTYKIYVDSIPTDKAYLYSFRFGNTKCDKNDKNNMDYSIDGGLNSDGSIWMGARLDNGKYILFNKTGKEVFKLNKWFHVTFVYDDDFKGTTIYMNGTLVKRSRNEECPTGIFKQKLFNNINIGRENNAKNCITQPIYCWIAWVHWFDYTIDKQAIYKDINTAYSNNKIYEEKLNTGWNFLNNT
jgi:hypothetical protein